MLPSGNLWHVLDARGLKSLPAAATNRIVASALDRWSGFRAATGAPLFAGAVGGVNGCHPLNAGIACHEALLKRLSVTRWAAHNGCVNRIAWNRSGSLLASGSDDRTVRIWDYTRSKLAASIPTGHRANIFAVRFLDAGDTRVVSGGMDTQVRVSSVAREECVETYECHRDRVKELDADPFNPACVYVTASEDGTCRQFDTRVPHACADTDSNRSTCANVLVQCKRSPGRRSVPYRRRFREDDNTADVDSVGLKGVHFNPRNPHLMCFPCGDHVVRVYDRRMLAPGAGTNSTAGAGKGVLPAYEFAPPQARTRHHTTYAQFSECGTQLVVSYSGEHVYVFDVHKHRHADHPKRRLQEELAVVEGEQKLEAPPRAAASTADAKADAGAAAAAAAAAPAVLTSAAANRHAFRTPSARADHLKQRGNTSFGAQHYTRAVSFYTAALQSASVTPVHRGGATGAVVSAKELAVLHSNRAMALLKRACEGDARVALADCDAAIRLDPTAMKAYYRRAVALQHMRKYADALAAAKACDAKFPGSGSGADKLARELDVQLERYLKQRAAAGQRAVRRRFDDSSEDEADGAASDDDSGGAAAAAKKPGGAAKPAAGAAAAAAVASSSSSDDDSDADERMRDDDDEVGPKPAGAAAAAAAAAAAIAGGRRRAPRGALPKRRRSYAARLVGHANVQTDIKEATFWGRDYVVSGSDDGRIFVWAWRTARLVAVLNASDDVINCVRAHPFDACLASSGIEHSVQIWRPRPSNDPIPPPQQPQPSAPPAGAGGGAAAAAAKPKAAADDDEAQATAEVLAANTKRMSEGPSSFMLDPRLLQLLMAQYMSARGGGGGGGGRGRGRGGARGGGRGGGAAGGRGR